MTIKVIEMPALENSARNIAGMIDQGLQSEHGQRVGFALFLFTFGEGGSLTYMANCKRDDMVKVVEEWLAREEGKT